MFDKIGFDSEQYLSMQSKHIKKRIEMFDNKLYLEFGGKLFDDFHASRVLPGFAPDSKIKMLEQLSDDVEIVIVISASDIENNKIRGDYGISYDLDVLRLIDAFRSLNLYVGSVVIAQYRGQIAANVYKKRLMELGVTVYIHYPIEGYPNNIPLIVSDEGFGQNEYIETKKPLVVVTAPGPGSGKMATCLSQLYHEHKRGLNAGYAKFETFPIWNLPLKHPVNLAYEAATADLNDMNMIDPFHLEAYGQSTVNYNRDVEVFPVLNAIYEKIFGKSPYLSPTDMGVNMVGKCIIDNDVVEIASKQEIIRRYYATKCASRQAQIRKGAIYKIELIMEQANISIKDRPIIAVANSLEEETNAPAAALQLHTGQIVTGKTSDLLGASAALLLNALKALGNIDKDVHLISPAVIEPIQTLKINHLGNNNPRLHTDEVLIALSISAVTDKTAQKALEQLENLIDTQMHTTVILSSVDDTTLKKLGIALTCEAKYQTKKLYHK